ncbi:MAG: metallophosphatase, partial [Mesorhizobium sp.]
MNFSLTRATLIAEADLIGIAGERAVCDPRGVLYFPDLR